MTYGKVYIKADTNKMKVLSYKKINEKEMGGE